MSGGAEAVPEEKIRAVGEWLTRLENRCDDGAMDAVAVGLRNWTAAAEACLVQDRAVLSAGETQLASLSELRGRLDALKAKARAYGLSEMTDISSLCGSAEDQLGARPMNLRMASEAVAHYEYRLRIARLGSEPAGDVDLR